MCVSYSIVSTIRQLIRMRDFQLGILLIYYVFKILGMCHSKCYNMLFLIYFFRVILCIVFLEEIRILL